MQVALCSKLCGCYRSKTRMKAPLHIVGDGLKFRGVILRL